MTLVLWSEVIGSSIVKKNDVTYGQLERVLRGFGFTCRPGNRNPPGRIYEHKQTGAIVALPAFSETEEVYPHHLLTARMALDDFGIAGPTTFDANLQKTG